MEDTDLRNPGVRQARYPTADADDDEERHKDVNRDPSPFYDLVDDGIVDWPRITAIKLFIIKINNNSVSSQTRDR